MSTKLITPERAREMLAQDVSRLGCEDRGFEAVLTLIADGRDCRQMSEAQLRGFFQVLELRRELVMILYAHGRALPEPSQVASAIPFGLDAEGIHSVSAALTSPDFLMAGA